MKQPLVLALLVGASLSSGSFGRAATLEYYFDFTKCGDAVAGSAIADTAHGRASARMKEASALSKDKGLLIAPDNVAGRTGAVLPAEALGVFTGDFTLQIWYRTGNYTGPNTLLYGGSTSEPGDDSIEGDQALFVGYNNRAGEVQFLRPITNDGTRWGADMSDTLLGTGTAPGTLYDYVLVYDSGARRFAAYMDGFPVGTMPANDFAGLPALGSGLAIGGVQNSAFPDDRAADVAIASFLMYRGALAGPAVARIHAFGPNPSLEELAEAGVSLGEVAASETAVSAAPAGEPAAGGGEAAHAPSQGARASFRRHRR